MPVPSDQRIDWKMIYNDILTHLPNKDKKHSSKTYKKQFDLLMERSKPRKWNSYRPQEPKKNAEIAEIFIF